jgi:O-antigen/teichoic acid export membrane protein
MKNDHYEMSINFILRGLTLIAKFCLTLFIAKYGSTKLLGEYTVFLTTITISIYFLGFEFYTYSQREILKVDHSGYSQLIKNQLFFHALSYLILLPLSYLIIIQFVENRYILFFFIILILDHLNQELYRLLVVVKQPLHATVNNFFRAGMWVILIILVWYSFGSTLSLFSIISYWVIGELFCLTYSIKKFRKYLNGNYNFYSLQKSWITKGVKVSFVFFISGMIQKMVEYSERFFLQKLTNDETVGVYFFYYNIAYLPFTFFSSVIIINHLPNIISTFTKNKEEFILAKKDFFKNTIYFCIFFIPICVFSYYIITNFLIIKATYQQSRYVFWILLTSSIITIISEFLYIELYIRHKDYLILLSYLYTFFIHIISNYFLINWYGLPGGVAAKLIVVCSLLIIRYILIQKYCNDKN